MRAASLIAALVASGACLAEEKHVKVLDTKSYETFVNSDDVSLVKFYAPWCGHCKTLAPEYERAAEALNGSSVRLGKIDCTQNDSICAKMGIEGYPTLKVFRNGKATEYSGPRDADGIVSRMRRMTLPLVSQLSLGKAVDFGKEHGVAIVGVFGSDSAGQKEAAAFEKIASEMREDHVFASIKPGVYMVKAFDEGHASFEPTNVKSASLTTSEGAEALRDWIQLESLPVMAEISQNNYANYMAKARPLAYLFYKGAEMRKEYGSFVEEVMRGFKGRVNAVYIDADQFDSHAKALTLPIDSWPGFVIHDHALDLKYPFKGEKLTHEVLAEFVQSFVDGKLEPTFRSQEIPDKDDGPVRTIVNKNFEELILSGKTDVLLEIYAPWCGACRRIAPTYEAVAASFANQSDKIIVGKMDGTENDIPKAAGITLTKFPTIVLFKAGKKGMVEMERASDKAEDFYAFIKANATNVVEPVVSGQNAGSPDVGSLVSEDKDEL